MEYNEKKAEEIARLWGVSAATLRTWKHRGEIPDMYRLNPSSLHVAIRKVDKDWREMFEAAIRQLGDEAYDEYLRYIYETQVPADLSASGVMSRLRDKRTHLRKNCK